MLLFIIAKMTDKSCDKCGNTILESGCPTCQITEMMSAKIISGIVEGFASLLEIQAEAKCPTCGITWDEVLQLGRVGCAYDYIYFKKKLEPILLKFHGAIRHKA